MDEIKEMTMKDLTPEIMKDLEGLKTVQEMKEYCLKKGYDLSGDMADRIVAQFEKSEELSDDEVEGVAGGEEQYQDMVDGHHPRYHYTC